MREHILGAHGYCGGWFEELPWSRKLFWVGVTAVLLAAAAQVRIMVPWTPVPITLQTFAFFLPVLVFGRTIGAGGASAYLGAGAVGIPCFQGLTGGLGVLAGPTGGYLVGFLVAVVLAGSAIARWPGLRRPLLLLPLLLVLNFGVVHVLGLVHLALVTGVHDPAQLLWIGTIPFVPGDIAKLLAVTAVAASIDRL